MTEKQNAKLSSFRLTDEDRENLRVISVWLTNQQGKVSSYTEAIRESLREMRKKIHQKSTSHT